MIDATPARTSAMQPARDACPSSAREAALRAGEVRSRRADEDGCLDSRARTTHDRSHSMVRAARVSAAEFGTQVGRRSAIEAAAATDLAAHHGSPNMMTGWTPCCSVSSVRLTMQIDASTRRRLLGVAVALVAVELVAASAVQAAAVTLVVRLASRRASNLALRHKTCGRAFLPRCGKTRRRRRLR